MDRDLLTNAHWAKMAPPCLGKPTDAGRSGSEPIVGECADREAPHTAKAIAAGQCPRLRPLRTRSRRPGHPASATSTRAFVSNAFLPAAVVAASFSLTAIPNPSEALLGLQKWRDPRERRDTTGDTSLISITGIYKPYHIVVLLSRDAEGRAGTPPESHDARIPNPAPWVRIPPGTIPLDQ